MYKLSAIKKGFLLFCKVYAKIFNVSLYVLQYLFIIAQNYRSSVSQCHTNFFANVIARARLQRKVSTNRYSVISKADHSSSHFCLKPEAEFITMNSLEAEDCFQGCGDYQ